MWLLLLRGRLAKRNGTLLMTESSKRILLLLARHIDREETRKANEINHQRSRSIRCAGHHPDGAARNLTAHVR
jgi:hypothetical protein